MKDEQARELYMEYKLLGEQYKKVQEYLEQTAENLQQVGDTIEALDAMGRQEKGARVFAPVANGIFIDATLNDPAHVRMNVGQGVVVTKTIEEAKGMLEQQREELHQLRDRANDDHARLTVRLKEIEDAIEAGTNDDAPDAGKVGKQSEKEE